METAELSEEEDELDSLAIELTDEDALARAALAACAAALAWARLRAAITSSGASTQARADERW